MFKTLNYTTTYGASLNINITELTVDETNMVEFSHFPDECIEELEDLGVVFSEFVDEADNSNGPVRVKKSDYDEVVGYFNQIPGAKWS